MEGSEPTEEPTPPTPTPPPQIQYVAQGIHATKGFTAASVQRQYRPFLFSDSQVNYKHTSENLLIQ